MSTAVSSGNECFDENSPSWNPKKHLKREREGGKEENVETRKNEKIDAKRKSSFSRLNWI